MRRVDVAWQAVRRLRGHTSEGEDVNDRTTMTSPVVPVDGPAFDEMGDPVVIYPCPDCLPWHAEVAWDAEVPGLLLVREWHAVGCPAVAREG